MAEPYVGEIRLMSFTTVPRGWAQCNGQQLAVSRYQALFALIGAAFGGDGRNTFQLPDLRDRVPMHRGPVWVQGQKGGEAAHQLRLNEIPAHTHTVNAVSDAANAPTGSGNFLAAPDAAAFGAAYAAAGTTAVSMHPNSLAAAGSDTPHENRQPFVTVSFCIALQGIFPSQS